MRKGIKKQFRLSEKEISVTARQPTPHLNIGHYSPPKDKISVYLCPLSLRDSAKNGIII